MKTDQERRYKSDVSNGKNGTLETENVSPIYFNNILGSSKTMSTLNETITATKANQFILAQFEKRGKLPNYLGRVISENLR